MVAKIRLMIVPCILPLALMILFGSKRDASAQTGGTFTITITVQETGQSPVTLRYGIALGATDGVDSALGESQLGSLPPSGNFDARFTTPGGVGLALDLRTNDLSGSANRQWQLNLQKVVGGGNVTISWDPNSLPSNVETLSIIDAANGFFGVNVPDMRQASSVTFNNSFATTILFNANTIQSPSPAPILEVSADTLAYPTTFVGITEVLSLTVGNSAGATANLVIDSLRIEGEEFKVVSPTTGFPLAVVPGGTPVVIAVQFAPALPTGAKNAILKIYHNDLTAGTPTDVTLNGIAVEPMVLVTIPQVNAGAGAAIELPIYAENFNDIGAITFKIAYNDTLLVFTGLSSVAPGVEFLGSASDGLISVAWIDTTGTMPLNLGDTTLLNLNFNVTGSVGNSTMLEFTPLNELADGEGNPISDVGFFNGSVTIIDFYSISGTVGYYANSLPVPNAELALTGDATQTDNSASDGTYMFSGLPAGSYIVMPSKNTDLGGVNATDALKVVRHTAGLEVITDPNQLTAGDVNQSGVVNSTDGLKIIRYTAGLDTLPSEDWKFLPDSRVYDPLNVDMAGQDFVGIRMGDVNGNWTPDGGAAKPVVVASEMQIIVADMVALGGKEIEVPIQISGKKAIGAMTLLLSYPADLLSFEGIKAGEFEPVFGDKKGVLKIAWADMTGTTPIQMESSLKSLLSLKFKVLGVEGDAGSIDVLAGTELADGSGTAIPIDVRGGTIRILTKPEEYALSQNYPNPFNPDTQIKYQLPEAGNVHLVIYNLLGQQIRTLIQEHQEAGYYQTIWDGKDARGRTVSSGVYIYQMKAGQFQQTRRMLLLK